MINVAIKAAQIINSLQIKDLRGARKSMISDMLAIDFSDKIKIDKKVM